MNYENELERWYAIYPRLYKTPLWNRVHLSERAKLFAKAREAHIRHWNRRAIDTITKSS